MKNNTDLKKPTVDPNQNKVDAANDVKDAQTRIKEYFYIKEWIKGNPNNLKSKTPKIPKTPK